MIGIIAAVIGVLGYIALGLLFVRSAHKVQNLEAAVAAWRNDWNNLRIVAENDRKAVDRFATRNVQLSNALRAIAAMRTPNMANIGQRMADRADLAVKGL